MPIKAPTPYEKPAVSIPPKTFNHLWIRDMEIQARQGNLETAMVYLNVMPINSETGEFDETAQAEYRINLWEYLTIPTEDGGPNPLAVAMGAVELAVPWVIEEKAKKNLAENA